MQCAADALGGQDELVNKPYLAAQIKWPSQHHIELCAPISVFHNRSGGVGQSTSESSLQLKKCTAPQLQVSPCIESLCGRHHSLCRGYQVRATNCSTLPIHLQGPTFIAVEGVHC